jgi:formamidopyrimidine-DNA glycosylase
MPELPEVEVLRRHLAPLLRGRVILGVAVTRPKTVAPSSPARFAESLIGAVFGAVERRGKYLLFHVRTAGQHRSLLLGHLGMTGRMFLAWANDPLPKHTAVALNLGDVRFVFEDTRYFGRLSLDASAVDRLGPEPLEDAFTASAFAESLHRSRQPIKVKLLDQSLVAGIGNIYASEALYLARVSPRRAANRLKPEEVKALRAAVRRVLREAIRFGSTVPLDFAGTKEGDGLFYYGRSPEAAGDYTERLRAYDRAGQPCRRCQTPIRRIVQAARSTYFCPHCQR